MTSPSNAIIALIASLLCVVAGCSLLHRERVTPQQQFLEALQRGDAPAASQIWLHMSPAERADLSHGAGLKPDVTLFERSSRTRLVASPRHAAPLMPPAARLKAKVRQNKKADGDDATFQQGDINSQSFEWPGLDADSDGLLALPSSLSEPAQQRPDQQSIAP
ncbi:MAG: hypothetical protein ACREQE_07860 [Candidatus Binataceae bacterium]